MERVIIGIHGMGNKPAQHLLEEWWTMALKEGVRLSGHPARDIPFKLAYWADLFHDEPQDAAEQDRRSSRYLPDPYVPSLRLGRRSPGRIRRRVHDAFEYATDRIFLGQDLRINFSGLNDLVLSRYFAELNHYHEVNCVLEDSATCTADTAIRRRLASLIAAQKGCRVMLIAHSMGSIIAYDTLTGCDPSPMVDVLVTLGSPLGIPVIMSRIAAEHGMAGESPRSLPTPDAVRGRWYNLADLEDRVAINYTLADDYTANHFGVRPVDLAVYNDYAYRGLINPHQAYGYLRTPELAERVLAFLDGRSLP